MIQIPIVSVIIITYNQEKYINQCIDSVLRQKTKFFYEVIVSDDNSTDNTKLVLNKYETKENVKIIHNKTNQGIIKNYLTALEACSGKYICLLGGDDYWIDDLKIQNQVEFLESNQEFGLVYTDYTVLNERSGNLFYCYISKFNKQIVEGDVTNIMCKGNNVIMPQTVCIRASLLNNEYKLIMDDKYFLAEDYPTWFWVSYYSKIHFINSNTAVYRVHNKSYTNSQSNIQMWNFSRSHNYMRKKIMYYLNYKPENWCEINDAIERGIMKLSLKTRVGVKYGIASFNRIVNKNLEDYLIYIGLKYSCFNYVARVLILFLGKFRLITINDKI